MFSLIRRHMTVANVLMTFALVFALSGGAYAASKIIIKSKRQISAKVLKELQKPGRQGPAGPQGVAGIAGKDGTNGKDGANGKDGTNGENVAAKAILLTETKCKGMGGVEYTLAGKATEVCNGQTGYTESLPSHKMETGTWGVSAIPGSFAGGFLEVALAPISFSIPLKERVAVFVVTGGAKGVGGGTCPTTSEIGKPEAEPGNLCVFVNENEFNIGKVEVTSPDTGEPEAAQSGAIIDIKPAKKAEPVLASGTWAVTAK